MVLLIHHRFQLFKMDYKIVTALVIAYSVTFRIVRATPELLPLATSKYGTSSLCHLVVESVARVDLIVNKPIAKLLSRELNDIGKHPGVKPEIRWR